MPVLTDALGTAETGGWAGGFIGAIDATELPPNASPRAKNSALAQVSKGMAYVQKRSGIRTMNRTPITASPAIIGNFEYTKNSTGTRYHLLYSNTGRLDKLNSDTTTTSLSTAFTSGDNYPAFEIANGLCFIVNGVDVKKFDGTTVTAFGITRPTVGSLSGGAGAGGSPSGTYELRVSYYNSNTGNESSISDTAASTVILSSQKLSLSNIPVSTDAQVTDVYAYVRNTATQTQFYKVGSVVAGVTTGTFDWVDANLTVVAPSTTSNNPPPSTSIDVCFHQGRMFTITPTGLFWSNLFQPEQFNPLNTNGVNASDGQNLTAIFSDHEVLLILKDDRLYVLQGSDPQTWTITLVDADVGCVTQRSVLSAGGYTYWWCRHGMVRWSGAGTVERIGQELYGDVSTIINANALATISAAYSETQQRLVMSVPGSGQSRATFMIPFSYLGDVFEADSWDAMDCASLGTAHDSSGVLQIYMGNYAGQVFRVYDTNADGIAEGTATGTFTATGTSQSVFTDLTAAFDITGAGLIERKLTILNSSGAIVGSTRRRITANTATTFTINVAVTGLVNGATYTYIIGGPDFQWDTSWRTFNNPWMKKRLEYLFTLIKGVSFGSGATLEVSFDYDDANANGQQRSIQQTAVGSVWDAAIWDRDAWDTPVNLTSRYRIGRVCRAWRIRYKNSQVNQPAALLTLSVQGVTETTKR